MVNIRLAARTLTRSPFVTTVAALSLALGIGANAAIFSLFHQLLVQKIPSPAADALVNLSAPGPMAGSTSCNQAGSCTEIFSYRMFRDLEAAQTGFQSLAAHRLIGANIAATGQTPISGEAMLVSGSYFPTLGLTPALGRLLATSDDQTIGAHFVAVLSHEYWTSKLGADPGVVGKAITINGQSFTVVGVGPEGFLGTTAGGRPSVFVPISMRGVLDVQFTSFDNRRSYWIYLFARLRPNTTLEQTAVTANSAFQRILREVDAPLQTGMSAATLERFKNKKLILLPGARGQSNIGSRATTPLTLLLGITGVVLLIACANIANLLLARAANRAAEMSVRLSLGAGRLQLISQLLTESVLLALLGGALSLLVARWTLAGITAVLPPEASAIIQTEIRVPVILFAAATAIVTGLLFGMVPALHSTRPDLITSIRASAGQLAGGRAATRFRTILVVVQLALSMTLLTSAGLFVKSLVNVSRIDLGLNTAQFVQFSVSPELNGYTKSRSRDVLDRIREALSTAPGVTSVATSMVPILAGSNWGTSVGVQGFKGGPDVDNNSRYNEVSPGYFRTLGVPLLSGREFDERDELGTLKVAVVNEAFAKKFNLGKEVVGKYMSMNGSDSLDILIVGLARNAKYSEVKDEIPPLFFVPVRQDSTLGSLYYYVRASGDPSQLMQAIPRLVASVDPSVPVENLRTLERQVKDNIGLDRLISILAAAFAALATLLAAVGLYGVLAYSIAQRTREIGVRMALGASATSVQTMVLRQVAVLTGIGAVLGTAAAVMIGRAAASLLYGMSGYDPVVIACGLTLLLTVSLLAGFVPARRASKVHPMQALRYE